MDVEPRITELEIAIAHQDRMLGELNSVVIEQEAAIARLQSEVDRLKEQVVQLLRAELPENAKPPHY